MPFFKNIPHRVFFLFSLTLHLFTCQQNISSFKDNLLENKTKNKTNVEVYKPLQLYNSFILYPAHLLCLILYLEPHFFRRKKAPSLFARSFTWSQREHRTESFLSVAPRTIRHPPCSARSEVLALGLPFSLNKVKRDSVPWGSSASDKVKMGRKNGGDYLILDRLNYLDWEHKRVGTQVWLGELKER